MQRKTKRKIYVATGLLTAFVLWTVLVSLVDVQPIGPQNSAVGLATVNGWFHNLVGVNMTLYEITDWLGLVPLGAIAIFAILGLQQWICRKSLKKVDFSILVLGGFYVLTLALFLLFEALAVNCRPVLIAGILEASYPSSTTMLVLCVISTAVHQLHRRTSLSPAIQMATYGLMAFAFFMVIGRLLSGVHWLSDIIGGGLVSAGLVTAYLAICELKD